MGFTVADLALARDRVAEGERRILRQRYVVEQLNDGGRSSANAAALLLSLLARLTRCRQELGLIEADLDWQRSCAAGREKRERCHAPWWERRARRS
jgi:hypothetical protein